MGIEWNAPYMPFDFRVVMPHHLGQDDEQSGAYIREGKSYKRLWVHAIHEGSKTRFWESDGFNAEQLGATQAYIKFYPGEEYAVYKNVSNPSDFEITRSLTNSLVPQVDYDEGQPWDNNDDSRSLYRGVHILPPKERMLAARGLTIVFYVKWCADRVRFLGWGGEFGPGPHNFFFGDPSYPYPVS